MLKRLFNRLNKLFDKFLPPIKFREDYFRKKSKPYVRDVSEEDLDKWAEEYERNFNNARRKKRGH